jgi:methylmalonyl-CoA/ethylmalonyl-CoA epimerase
MIQRITHIGHVVRDLDRAIDLYTGVLGFTALSPQVSRIPGGKAFMVAVGDQSIELIQPTDADHRVGLFLDRHGEGWFHVSFRSDDIDAQVRSLRGKGIALEDPRYFTADRTGPRISFIDPSSVCGAVIELNEAGPNPAPALRPP